MITEPIKFTKRIGHLFERVVDLDNIKLAIRNAAKRKSDRPSVRRILQNIDKHARKLQEILITESWIPHPYHIREINDGIKKKKRIIAVPRFFPDQCIHHAFVLVFRAVVEHGAYEHSCGCVPGKGTDGARKVIKRWIRNDPKGTTKVAVLDVKQCYPTLPHKQLRLKLEKRIKDRKFLQLAFKIIASYQQAMANKTQLLPETIAVGIPVGLYTSPWFLNFFFQDLDHLVAETCGLSHLARYVDDMVLFDNSKKRLHGDPWYYVKISGSQGDKYGFVSAAYITKQSTSKPSGDTTLKDDGVITKTPQWTGKVTADVLNVRSWAGTNNPLIKSWPKLSRGNLVDICDVVNAADGSRWYYIRIDGRIYGFVHSAYIAKA